MNRYNFRECELKYRNTSAYLDACDNLYYGYGFAFRRKRHEDLDPVEADHVWNTAFMKVAEDEYADYTPHSIEAYDNIMQQKRAEMEEHALNVDGRYKDYNINVIDDNGAKSLYAQGGAPNGVKNNLAGIRAISGTGSGNTRMTFFEAREEFIKNSKTINASKSAQQAYRLGRLGNVKPLHRKNSLNRAFETIPM